MHSSAAPLLTSVTYAPAPERAGQRCAAPECATLVLFTRFCDGCFADAAKQLAQRLEQQLIGLELEPGTPELRDRLKGAADAQRLEFFQNQSELGDLNLSEAVYLRTLAATACHLVATGGVAALALLPGTRHEGKTLILPRPVARQGVCDFRGLPQGDVLPRLQASAESDEEREAQTRRFQTACLIVMTLAAAALLVIR